jgi:crotonobetainyl-CoA:carnitine CoA-transferase CaiB-like acyl-CoA transferase
MDQRRRHRDELVSVLDQVFAADSTAAWVRRLRDRGVPVGPVQTMEQALEDPFCGEREMLVEVDHPELGPLALPATAAKVGAARADRNPGPAFGADNRALLADLLGITDAKYAALAERGAFG